MTRVVVITPPEPYVSLEEAKQHSYIDASDNDALVMTYIEAAIASIDGPTGWVGRCFGTQTLEARYCAFDAMVDPLPYGPVQSIVSVKYLDPDGIEQTVPDTGYYDLRASGVLGLAYGATWPTALSEHPEAIRVRYVAGYGTLPASVKAAVLLTVGQLYLNRESEPSDALGDRSAVKALLRPFYDWNV